ncbi:hypothetical protein [Halococcus thailandensis]|uniref:Uncharacterized protein n=1 Tax=Halococcus thailandensis JCM 13552 TaxID=1227457 RepID=M0NHJ3_9EURY|nr:hypothetical protein [Halococcus thailandensis]EMA56120.1 hypothetical protein C451_03974 [Halococcus thailandensis JCM 13552]
MTDYSDLDDEQIVTQHHHLRSMLSNTDGAKARIEMIQNGMDRTVKQPEYDDRNESIAEEIRDMEQTLNRIQALIERDMQAIEDRHEE